MNTLFYKIFLLRCLIVVSMCVQIEEASAAKLETWRLDCFDYNLRIHDTISACSTFLRGGKPDPKYFIKRGGAWLFLKDYEYAISDFGKAIDKRYGGILPYYGRAAAYVGSGQFYGALRDLEKVLTQSFPDLLLHKAIHNLLAWISIKEIDNHISEKRDSEYSISNQNIIIDNSKLINKIDSDQYYVALFPFVILIVIMSMILV